MLGYNLMRSRGVESEWQDLVGVEKVKGCHPHNGLVPFSWKWIGPHTSGIAPVRTGATTLRY